MAKISILAGATSESINIWVQDSSSTVGAGLSNIAPAGGSLLSGFKGYYSFAGANTSATAITLSVIGSVGQAYLSGGIVEIDATNMKGFYRVDLPNAVIQSGKGRVVSLNFYGGTNVAQCAGEIELTAINNQSTGFGLVNASSNVVQWNGTNVASPATAGIPEINVKNINNVSTSSVTTINANQGTTQPLNFTGAAGSALVKSDMVDVAGAAVSTSSAQLGVNVVNIAGAAAAIDANNFLKVDVEDWKGATAPAMTGDAFARLGAPAGASVSADIAAVKSDTGTLVTGVNVTKWSGTAVAGSIPPDTIFTRSNTATAGGANTITLDAGASAVDNFYQNETIYIRSGTGAGQSAVVTSYVGATKVATVGANWATAPDNTSVFTLAAFGPSAATVSGTVAANVTQVNGHAVTDTSSGIMDVNAKNVNNATAATMGTPAGASMSADIASVKSDTVHCDVNTSTRATPASILTTALTEAYASLHGTMTLSQILFEMRAILAEKSVVGTTVTVNKTDGSTAAETFLLNSATLPTSISRAS